MFELYLALLCAWATHCILIVFVYTAGLHPDLLLGTTGGILRSTNISCGEGGTQVDILVQREIEMGASFM